MIDKTYYLDNYVEFLDEKLLDAEPFSEMLPTEDYKKHFGIEEVFAENAIEVEVKAWKKFYLKRSGKAFRRPFTPIVTYGDVSRFIQQNLLFMQNEFGEDVADALEFSYMEYAFMDAKSDFTRDLFLNIFEESLIRNGVITREQSMAIFDETRRTQIAKWWRNNESADKEQFLRYFSRKVKRDTGFTVPIKQFRSQFVYQNAFHEFINSPEFKIKDLAAVFRREIARTGNVTVKNILKAELKFITDTINKSNLAQNIRHIAGVVDRITDQIAFNGDRLRFALADVFRMPSLEDLKNVSSRVLSNSGSRFLRSFFRNGITQKLNDVFRVTEDSILQAADFVNIAKNLAGDPKLKRLLSAELTTLRNSKSSYALARIIDIGRDLTKTAFDVIPDRGIGKLAKDSLMKLVGERNARLVNGTTKLLSRFLKVVPEGDFKQRFGVSLMKYITGVKYNSTQDNVFDFVNMAANSLMRKNRLLGRTNAEGMIDFVFDIMTDYDLTGLGWNGKPATLAGRMKYRWMEFLKKEVFKTDGAIQPSDFFDQILGVFQNLKKDFLTTENIFKFNFEDALFKAINKQLSPFDFNKKIRKVVRMAGRDMFRLGVTELGFDYRDFREIEDIAVSALNRVSGKFLDGLTSRIENGVISYAQATLISNDWANTTLGKYFQYARLAVDRDGLYEWVYGDTVHCPSCLAANGQRHRLKHWWAAGILPQNHGSKDIICKGHHCKCRLKRVTGKAVGRLTRIPLAR